MSDKGNLVITRTVNQSVMIGDDIEITVVHIRPSRVRLSIKAPQNVTVLRNELIEREAERAGT